MDAGGRLNATACMEMWLQGLQKNHFSQPGFAFLPQSRPSPRVREDHPGAEVRTCSLDLWSLCLKPIMGLEECSILAPRDNQHREVCFKNVIKDLLGSFGHHIALATSLEELCVNESETHAPSNQRKMYWANTFPVLPQPDIWRISEVLCQVTLARAHPRNKQPLRFVAWGGLSSAHWGTYRKFLS